MMTEKNSPHAGERIAKVIARAGLASRREAEAWIAAGRVALNGAVIASPAVNVGAKDQVSVDGKPLPTRERTRLFLYHKPRGLVTTHADPQGRPTIFGALPKELPRLISVGRLDLNTEGLLLLTNDGGLARVLELPDTAWLRRYRVRANGTITQPALDALRDGVTVEGIRYGAIEATLDRVQGANVWLTFAIREGKNREVRNVLDHLGLRVNRLIRVSFGPFQLTELEQGAVEEVKGRVLREQLGERIANLAGADLSETPITREKNVARAPGRHPEARAGEAGKLRRPARPSSFEARPRRAPRDDGNKADDRREKKAQSAEATKGRRQDRNNQDRHDQGKQGQDQQSRDKRGGAPRRASDRTRGKGRRSSYPKPGKPR